MGPFLTYVGVGVIPLWEVPRRHNYSVRGQGCTRRRPGKMLGCVCVFKNDFVVRTVIRAA